MTNNLSDFQKQLFLDIYKTTLSAMIAGERANIGVSDITDDMLVNAAKTALTSVDFLTNDIGELCKPCEIRNRSKQIDDLCIVDFPQIED